MHRKLTSSLTAFTIGIGCLAGVVATTAPAQAAQAYVWADVYIKPGCSNGAYDALTTGAATSRSFAIHNMRYPLYKGNNYGHGAWMTTVGSVMVQPHAKATLNRVPGPKITLVNSSDFAKCYSVPIAHYEYLDLTGL